MVERFMMQLHRLIFQAYCYYFSSVDSKSELAIEHQPEERHEGLLIISRSDSQLTILQQTELGDYFVEPLVGAPMKIMKTLTKQNVNVVL